MTYKSQEQAISLPEEAKESGALDPAIENRLAKLVGTEARPELEEVLEASATAESAETENLPSAQTLRPRAQGRAGLRLEENPELTVYSQEYNQLPDNVKARASWEAIAERLLDNDSEKLKLAKAMQGEGQLVGVDAEGKALFKDKGVEPVMYGFDEEDKLLKIYNRDPEQMKRVAKWANYFEMREQVLIDGYELFADDGNYDFSDEMKQVTDHTKKPFVASEDREEWRVSWLESGDKPDYARSVDFSPNGGDVFVNRDTPEYRNDGYGVVRLLRV